MKVCVAQINPVNGDIGHNIETHKKLIGLAVPHNADMIIFPELSVTGYEPKVAEELATTAEDKRFDDFQVLSDQHNLIIGIGAPLKTNYGITISLVIFQSGLPIEVYHKKYIHPMRSLFL